ncbi:uncharacterized protein STEHIDRAFT_155050 [Stereum hirsutum FP-91666 SS1]|uniref:uncharacterized protein n=1 Tax=Stereum hirsutum (strain FP-91666) TaxID=721885 RepID=UPI000440BA20|nr:uncharacterized protein STEHIDRAFT_155050 [Stereum hirsutum FP-91666 SS1]EIM89382.1 hypothetical protein STEHIDRAFT_155050 [Stereum hirsutum FP-91666 SS1]
MADIYSLSYSSDRLLIRITVYGTFILDTFLTVIFTRQAWHMLSSGWGQVSALERITWEYGCIPLISGIIAFWVQAFYARRIVVLGKSRTWTAIGILIVAIGSLQAISAIVSGILIFSITSVQQIFGYAVSTVLLVWLSASIATDAMIAFSMVYLLNSARNNNIGYQNMKTDRLLTRLIKLTVGTNGVTAMTSIVNIIVLLVLPETNFFALMGYLISRHIVYKLSTRVT